MLTGGERGLMLPDLHKEVLRAKLQPLQLHPWHSRASPAATPKIRACRDSRACGDSTELPACWSLPACSQSKGLGIPRYKEFVSAVDSASTHPTKSFRSLSLIKLKQMLKWIREIQTAMEDENL